MNIPMMSGTLSPEQMQQQGMQQAMIDALRQQPQQVAPQQGARQVASAGGLGDGMDAGLIGGALRKVGNNIGTAAQYGTNPFSQQTNMLAAQDAAFL